jgi:hypothetical protein
MVHLVLADSPFSQFFSGGYGGIYVLSAASGRTVRVASADLPLLLAGQSASAWQVCSLVRFLSPFFRAFACVSRNRS